MTGHASAEDTRVLGGNILKLEILKLLELHWNYQSYHHHVTLYHFECFTIPSGGPSWLLPTGLAVMSHSRCKLRPMKIDTMFLVNHFGKVGKVYLFHVY